MGKIALIMYAFSVAMLFGAYYMNQIFNDPILGGNDNITFDAMNTLAQSFSISEGVNASLLFGDFIAGLKVLFGIVTGSTINSSFQLIPFVDVSILLLQGIMFDLASVFLWIYIVSNRSL
jgi:hypothetical protein